MFGGIFTVMDGGQMIRDGRVVDDFARFLFIPVVGSGLVAELSHSAWSFSCCLATIVYYEASQHNDHCKKIFLWRL